MAAYGSDGTSSSADTVAPGAGMSITSVKSVVFFLGDGMGMTTMTTARIYEVDEGDELTMDTLPETGFVRTFSNDMQVTDSAPSTSTYITGMKMNSGVISMSPGTMTYDASGKDYLSGADSIRPSGSDKPVTTLLELMKAAGCGTGVVTTTRITHATSAAAYSHTCHHDNENAITAQLTPAGKGFNIALDDGVDVIFGGGRKYFRPTTAGGARTDGRDLIAGLRADGYRYVSSRTEFDTLQATGGKVVGLFTSSHVSYDPDYDPSKEPSLGEMTSKAINMLAAKKKGFFLMVGGDRIDHALYETTARKVLQGTMAFNSAIHSVIDKLSMIDPGLKNTLIAVTTNHDHTLILNDYARRTSPTSNSNPSVLSLLKNYVTGTNATGTGDNPFTITGFGTGENRPVMRGALTDAAVYDKNYHQEAMTPVTPGSETHGGTDVSVGARGLDAERFAGTMNNTEVLGLIKQAIGL